MIICIFKILALFLGKKDFDKFSILFVGINFIDLFFSNNQNFEKIINGKINLFILQINIGKILELFSYFITIFITFLTLKKIIYLFRSKEIITQNKANFLKKLLSISIFTIFMLRSLQIIGIDISKLAIITGGLSVGLGFGLQKIAANFISGILISLDKKINIGDLIEIIVNNQLLTGYIKKIDSTSSIIETFSKEMIIVPNEYFIISNIKNITGFNRKSREKIDFVIDFNQDLNNVLKITRNAFEEMQKEFKNILSFNARVLDILDYGIKIGTRFHVANIDIENEDIWTLKSKIIINLKKRLNENEIYFTSHKIEVINSKN